MVLFLTNQWRNLFLYWQRTMHRNDFEQYLRASWECPPLQWVTTILISLLMILIVAALPTERKMSRLGAVYSLLTCTVSYIMCMSMISSNVAGFTKKMTASVSAPTHSYPRRSNVDWRCYLGHDLCWLLCWPNHYSAVLHLFRSTNISHRIPCIFRHRVDDDCHPSRFDVSPHSTSRGCHVLTFAGCIT